MRGFLRRQYDAMLWRIERRIMRAHSATGVWIDVGAHRGDMTLEPARRNPALVVHAFEPNPEAARALAGQLPNYHVHAMAVGEQDGEVDFHLNAFEAASSTLPLDPQGLAHWAGGEELREVRSMRVPCTRLDSFLAAQGIDHVDWLKVDAQGADLAVVRSLGARVKDVGRITLEVQTTPQALYRGAADEASVLEFMRQAGFVLAHSELQSRGQERNLTFERPGAARAPVALTIMDRLLLALAGLLSRTRPLAPAPGWRFGADLDVANLPTKIRKWIFWHFQATAAEAPLELAWHHGLRLELPLGADAARCLFVGGRIDPNELAFLDQALQPGQVFIDVGANDGLYSLFAARKVGAAGRVLAVEPSPRELARLRRHLALNGIGNVSVAAVALGERAGRARLMLADGAHAGQNTFGTFGYGGTRLAGAEAVPVETLDELVAREGLPRVDVIKLDIEGAEMAALAGAGRTLATFRPRLLIEVFDDALRAQGSSADALLKHLDALGYDIHTFDEATGRPRPARPGEALSLNVVAVHREPRALVLDKPRVEGEFILDCLGGRTQRRFYDFDRVLERQPMQALDVFAPSRNEEHYDWIDLFEAASRARGPLTVVELGAGHGRWLVHAANLARRTGRPLGCLVGCEAEPTHFAWMLEHFRDNGLDPAAHRLVRAAVAPAAGTLPFYVGAAASWYGQSVAENVVRHGRGGLANVPGWLRRFFGRERPQDLVEDVPAVTLESLLEGIDTVDFLHMDIQGAEYDVLAASMDVMDRKVRLAHIGTHSPGAEATRGRDMDALVHGLFMAHGWQARVRVAPEATHSIEGTPVRFVDGVQSWLNLRR